MQNEFKKKGNRHYFIFRFDNLSCSFFFKYPLICIVSTLFYLYYILILLLVWWLWLWEAARVLILLFSAHIHLAVPQLVFLHLLPFTLVQCEQQQKQLPPEWNYPSRQTPSPKFGFASLLVCIIVSCSSVFYMSAHSVSRSTSCQSPDTHRKNWEPLQACGFNIVH